MMERKTQLIVVRNALGESVSIAELSVYKNLLDQTVQMYWKTCHEIDGYGTEQRLELYADFEPYSLVEISKIIQEIITHN